MLCTLIKLKIKVKGQRSDVSGPRLSGTTLHQNDTTQRYLHARILNYLNCVNLAWNMESWVRISIPSLGLTSKNDINKHV